MNEKVAVICNYSWKDAEICICDTENEAKDILEQRYKAECQNLVTNYINSSCGDGDCNIKTNIHPSHEYASIEADWQNSETDTIEFKFGYIYEKDNFTNNH